MHAVSFGLKRGHLSAVAEGRRVVEGIDGMTPARFDLLYLLRRAELDDPENRTALTAVRLQSELWRLLGLHRSTVCELVARLLEMGWIWRKRSTFDRRTWEIFLTPLGLRKIFRAMKQVFRGRAVLKEYEALFRPKTPAEKADPANHVVLKIDRAVEMMRGIARRFGDRSRVWYDYGHPPENWSFGLAYRMP